MKFRTLTNLILSAALLLSAAGCSSSEEPGASSQPDPSISVESPVEEPPTPFTLPFYPDYSLNPALTETRANLALAPLLYEGLFSLDDAFNAVPSLSKSYSVSEDGLTWTFTLRSGVTFSDGTPLTGQLAAQSLNASLAAGSRYAGRISGLRSVTGSQSAVTIQLTTPNGALPTLLDIPITKDSSARPLGTGPYKLAAENGEYALVPRSEWWQSNTPPFDSILLSAIHQAGDLIAAFDSGDVTLLDTDLTDTNSLGYSGSYKVWDYNTTNFIYLGFNTTKGYCKDPAVRQALSRGIDRTSITNIPYARHAVPSSLPVHPDSSLYDPTLAIQDSYAPNLLVAFLDSHPAPGTPLTLLVNSENSAKVAAAQYIAYQLESAGLSVTVKKLPWDGFLQALAAGNFDFYLGEVLLTSDFDLSALLSSTGSLNYGRWQDPQTDLLLSAFRSASPSTRTDSANALYQHLLTQAPIAPICFKYGCVLTQWSRLSGLQPRPNNIFNNLEQWVLDPSDP